jgi:hypothetical protein
MGGEKDRARLTIIDSVTNAIIRDEIIDELTYEVKRNFIHYSLKGLAVKWIVY